ncbi:MAG TPA: hypothetical protein VFG89_09535 [Coriobacteriia bacterium]|nr:hypothetical protein [Coriobacteriia bacterium]
MTPKRMWKRAGRAGIVTMLSLALIMSMATTVFAQTAQSGEGDFAAPYAPYTAGPVVSEERPYAPYTAGPVVRETPYAPYTAGPVVRETFTLPYAGFTDLAPRPGVNPRIGQALEY